MYLPLNGTKRKGQIQNSGSVLCTNATVVANGHTEFKATYTRNDFKNIILVSHYNRLSSTFQLRKFQEANTIIFDNLHICYINLYLIIIN